MGVIRILLAIAVVLAHSEPIFGYSYMSGKVAVQVFYIISGFYMSLILNEKYNSYKLFISNRFLRLFPMYWLVLVLTIIVSIGGIFLTNGLEYGRLDGFKNFHENLSVFGWIIVLFSNVFLIFQDIIMFINTNTDGSLTTILYNNPNTISLHKFLIVPQAWTIGVELAFYLIAPFIVRKNIYLLIFLLSTSLFIKHLLNSNGLNYDPWTYRFFPAEMTFFFLGILSYKLYIKIKDVKINKLLANIVLSIELILILSYNYIRPEIFEILFVIQFSVLLPILFIHTKYWKIDRYIGELSYPIYISHIFIITILNGVIKKIFEIETIWQLGLIAVISTMIFSIFTNELFLRRIEVIRKKRIKQ